MVYREIIFPTKDIKKKYPFIDGIFVINVIDNNERFEYIKNELKKFNILEETYIIRSQKDTNFDKGCYESHEFVAKLSLKKGMKNTLIFEDDFKINCSNFFKKLKKKMEHLPKNYFRLMIGHIPITYIYDINSKLYKGNTLCCTCYLFSEYYAKWVPDYNNFLKIQNNLNAFQRLFGNGIDHVFSHILKKSTYQIIPSLVLVNEYHGSNTNLHKNNFWDKYKINYKTQIIIQYLFIILIIFVIIFTIVILKLKKKI